MEQLQLTLLKCQIFRRKMPKKKVFQILKYLTVESFFLEKTGGKIHQGLLAETSRLEAVSTQILQDAFLVAGRVGYCAQVHFISLNSPLEFTNILKM